MATPSTIGGLDLSAPDVHERSIHERSSPFRRRHWSEWLGKGVVAIVDQGLVSGSNFALNVLLARWLTRSDYGAYSVVFAVFLLAATLCQAALHTPCAVLGSTTFRSRRREYVGALVGVQSMLAGCASLLFGLAALVIHWLQPTGGLPGALGGMALALPFIVLFWLMRAAAYLEMRPGLSATGAGIYCALLLSGVCALFFSSALSAFTAFLLMMVASLGMSLFLIWRLRPMFRSPGLSWRDAWNETWRMGRWETLVAVALWLPDSFCYLIAGGTLGVAAAGSLRAVHNLVLPVSHFLIAFVRLITPHVATQFEQYGPRFGARRVYQLTCVATAATVGYTVLVTLFAGDVANVLYAGKFSGIAALVPLMATSAVLWGLNEVFAVGLRALRQPRRIVKAQCVGALLFVVTAPIAAGVYGLAGLITSMLISHLAAAALQFVMLQQSVRLAVGEDAA